MLSRISIRWRILIFQVLTMAGIGVVLIAALFAVFGVAVNQEVELLATARVNEAARVVEATGTLTDEDLAQLGRDNVLIVALNADNTVVAEIGSGIPIGTQLGGDPWELTLSGNRRLTDRGRDPLEQWDDAATFLHAEPIASATSAIAVVGAGVSYDYVGETNFAWVTFAIAGFGILLIVLVLTGAFFLVRYSLAPVAAIAASVDAISAADLSRRLPVRSSHDEFGQLATTFNTLLDRLEIAFRERDAVLARQRRFIADASHELRTPLTSVLGYARMLDDWAHDDPAAACEATRALRAEAGRMETLVEGLLQLARTDEIDVDDLVRTPTDITAIITDAVERARLAATRGVRVFGPPPPPTPPVRAEVDAGAIRQVLDVLLDNALRYTVDGGEVVVALASAPAGTMISVTDDGPGIDVAERERIFERFYRSSTSRTGRGAGLGLAIAKSIVERHGGQIAVENVAGHGARFTVRLPNDSTSAPSSSPFDAGRETPGESVSL